MTKAIDAIEPTDATTEVRAESREMTEDELDLIWGGTAIELPVLSMVLASVIYIMK
jgi:hypothetical protein